MTKAQKRLVLAIHTANGWSSDQSDGVNLLSLGTTRKIHSEEHRKGCIREIDGNILWNRGLSPEDADEINDPKRDIPALEALKRLVESAEIGHEWLTDAENMRFNEILYQSGRLV